MSEETTTSYTWEDYNEWRQKNLALQTELDKHRWIPVSEGLPRDGIEVWVSNGKYCWKDTYSSKNKMWKNLIPGGGELVIYSHWMHIHLPDDQEASDAQS